MRLEKAKLMQLGGLKEEGQKKLDGFKSVYRANLLPTIEKFFGDNTYAGDSSTITIVDIVYFTEINQVSVCINREPDKTDCPKLYNWYKTCLENTYLKAENDKLKQKKTMGAGSS